MLDGTASLFDDDDDRESILLRLLPDKKLDDSDKADECAEEVEEVEAVIPATSLKRSFISNHTTMQ